MSLLLDLGESRTWVTSGAQWPAWLDARWLSAQDARMVCRLSDPDDLTALRTIVPDPTRLVSYPEYAGMRQHFSQEDTQLVHIAFLRLFNASRIISITPGLAEQPAIGSGNSFLPNQKAIDHKPTLAFVSPLPPTASGIANYCVEILPALARFYEITLVVENPAALDPTLAQQFAVSNHAQLMRQGNRFDRVMYHFGNSPFHYDYFMLLQAHPGVVVLHDIYLGDCILSNRSQLGTAELYQAIYASHGWAAMTDCAGPVAQAIGLYPACGSVFSDSYGVIVHNAFARAILSQYFGEKLLSQLAQIPLARTLKELPDKTNARRDLGIADESRVYASFGLINQYKCIEELLEAWEMSGLASESSARLYLVGGCSNTEIEKNVRGCIARLRNKEQVILTGYVDNRQYDQYLGATDVAVQLRRESRGESSAALLDCMGAGLATIINAHGSMAELPDDSVIKLADDFSLKELAQALRTTFETPAMVDAMSMISRSHVRKFHAPDVVAKAYHESMESSYAKNAKLGIRELNASVLAPKVKRLSAATIWTLCEEINDLMACAGHGESLLAGQQLLVDISAVVRRDHGSGIQRVVRNILRELLMFSQSGYRVEAVYYDFESECFRYARTFVNQFMGLAPLYLCDDAVEARPGDIFLGLDLYYAIPERAKSRKWLQFWRGRGVRICHVVYDLLPIVLPDCFPPDQVPLYTNWLKAVTQVSDSVVCISKAIADEYRTWLEQQAVREQSQPQIGYFHLGAEMESRGNTVAVTHHETQVLNKLREQPYLLMVGTIEPRKGHEQVLDAFEALWSQGSKLSLVVVGTMGWIDGRFATRIKRMKDESSTFHWLDYVSDNMLKLLYQQAAGTMMASLGEGFGLPLIEAAYYGSSLLARDLPVFREVCGNSAWYFNATDAQQLASELQEWLNRYHTNSLPDSGEMKWMNWKQSSEKLLANVIVQRDDIR
jgi:glycosyltransferase involved in cell wall biosynthesis